ncbi:MAG: hypothetical protein ACFB6S_09090 [Geminicoccaceae bacterium]
MYRKLILLLTFVCLASCTASQESFRPGPVSFEDEKALAFALERHFVEWAPNLDTEPSLIERRIDVSLLDLTEQMLRTRLRTVGGNGNLISTIERASLVSEPIPTTGGFSGIFKREEDTRHRATLAARLETSDAVGNSFDFIRLEVRRTQTTREGQSPRERQEQVYQLMLATLDDLYEALRTRSEGELAQYLASGS